MEEKELEQTSIELDEQVDKPNINPVRLETESYSDYRIRRNKVNKWIKNKLRGVLFHHSATYFPMMGRSFKTSDPYVNPNKKDKFKA
jgi:hypothetical protein